MQLSTEGILTTHTGSLPRPPELTTALLQRDRTGASGEHLVTLIRDAVADVVRRQVDAGVSVVNDGESSKVTYSTYVKERLDGFDDDGRAAGRDPEVEAFPEFAQSVGRLEPATPACVGPVAYRDPDAVRADIANLQAALEGAGAQDAFASAASPGVISMFLPNLHYVDHEAYLAALADAMKVEYDEIHRAGLVVQLDCPDLAAGRHLHGATLRDFRRRVALHLEAIDHATRDIPAEQLRIHLCWGNYEGPHTHDVALRDVIDLVLAARPSAISFEAANPRHAHEWVVFDDIPLPDGKVLIPGVLDSTTNYVEHPELVAQRIVRYAELVGRERVIAGTDCGFATFASRPTVHPTIAWAKLHAMSEGAELASRRLWR